jgi:hypothetical protein
LVSAGKRRRRCRGQYLADKGSCSSPYLGKTCWEATRAEKRGLRRTEQTRKRKAVAHSAEACRSCRNSILMSDFPKSPLPGSAPQAGRRGPGADRSPTRSGGRPRPTEPAGSAGASATSTCRHGKPPAAVPVARDSRQNRPDSRRRPALALARRGIPAPSAGRLWASLVRRLAAST